MRMSHRRGLSALAALALIAGSAAIATPAQAMAPFDWLPDPVVSPASGARYDVHQVTLSWTPKAGISQYYLYLNGAPQTVTGTSITLAGLADGNYDWRVAFPEEEYRVFSTHRSFTIDTTAPVVTLATTPSTPIVAGSPLTLTGSIADLTLQSSKVFLDDGDLGVSFNGATSIPTAGLTTGTHKLRVDATDGFGRGGTAETTFQVVDAPWPADPLIAPANNAIFSSYFVPVSWTPKAGETDYVVFLDANQFATTGTSALVNPSTEGSHTWKVAYWEELPGGYSNLVFSPTRTFLSDVSAPQFLFGSMSATRVAPGTPIVVTGSQITDLTSVTASVYIDGVYKQPFSTTTSTSISTVGLAAGSHTLRVEAVDAAGHATNRSATFDIDLPWPADPLLAPAAYQALGSRDSISLSWTPKDGADGYRVIYFGPSASGSIVTDAATTSATLPSLPADGTYTWYVQYRTPTSGGVYTSSGSRPFTVDTLAPIVTLSTNRPTPIVPGTSVQLNGNVADGTATTKRVFLDGNDIGAFTTGMFVATTGLTAGTHTLRVDATDVLGHVGSGSVTFEVVTSWTPDPISSPAAGTVLSTPLVPATWALPPAGAAGQTIRIQYPDGTVTGFALSATATSHTFAAAGGDGVYTWWVGYNPAGGGVVESPRRTVVLDRAAPSSTRSSAVPARASSRGLR